MISVEQILKSVIEKVDTLPTLPVIAQKIMQLADNQSLSIDTLKNVVGGDPAIMVKIIVLPTQLFSESQVGPPSWMMQLCE